MFHLERAEVNVLQTSLVSFLLFFSFFLFFFLGGGGKGGGGGKEGGERVEPATFVSYIIDILRD